MGVTLPQNKALSRSKIICFFAVCMAFIPLLLTATAQTAYADDASITWDGAAPDISTMSGSNNVVTVELFATGKLLIPPTVDDITLNGPGLTAGDIAACIEAQSGRSTKLTISLNNLSLLAPNSDHALGFKDNTELVLNLTNTTLDGGGGSNYDKSLGIYVESTSLTTINTRGEVAVIGGSSSTSNGATGISSDYLTINGNLRVKGGSGMDHNGNGIRAAYLTINSGTVVAEATGDGNAFAVGFVLNIQSGAALVAEARSAAVQLFADGTINLSGSLTATSSYNEALVGINQLNFCGAQAVLTATNGNNNITAALPVNIDPALSGYTFAATGGLSLNEAASTIEITTTQGSLALSGPPTPPTPSGPSDTVLPQTGDKEHSLAALACIFTLLGIALIFSGVNRINLKPQQINR